MMKITKGDKTIEVSGAVLLIGALLIDNVVANVCKAKSYKNFCKAVKNEKGKA